MSQIQQSNVNDASITAPVLMQAPSPTSSDPNATQIPLEGAQSNETVVDNSNAPELSDPAITRYLHFLTHGRERNSTDVSDDLMLPRTGRICLNVLTVAVLVPHFVLYALGIDRPCDQPLHAVLLVNAFIIFYFGLFNPYIQKRYGWILDFVSFGSSFQQIRTRGRINFNDIRNLVLSLYVYFYYFSYLFVFAWWITSTVLLFKTQTCKADNPLVYWTVFSVFIVYTVIFSIIILACIFGLVVICREGADSETNFLSDLERAVMDASVSLQPVTVGLSPEYAPLIPIYRFIIVDKSHRFQNGSTNERDPAI